MALPGLKIGRLESRFPVIQAGMGVRVGNFSLAAASINCGAFGTIASVGLGDIEKSKTDFVAESNRVLIKEIRKAREMAPNGPLGVNIMVALSNYAETARASVEEGVDFIISGAGLPTRLPEYVGDADVELIPVISSGRALEVVVKNWIRKYDRLPGAVIVENPWCGGHLGFSLEELERSETRSSEILFNEASEVLEKYDCDVPIIAAGEISDKEDIDAALAIGYAGVQIGTRFIVAEEAGIDEISKQVFIDADASDIVVIKSPVGLPVRVLNTPLVRRVLEGRREKFSCPYRCLRSCNPAKVPFCIAKALLATWRGDVDNGLYMTGCDIDSVMSVAPLREFFDSLDDSEGRAG